MNEEQLLDWHYRADAGLTRLKQRLRVEAKPRRRFEGFSRRLVAVAALVLVLFGLANGLGPLPVNGGEEVVGVLGPFAQAIPAPARGGPEALKLDRGLGQPVNLTLEVFNLDKRPRTLLVGGLRTSLQLELSGPGVIRLSSADLKDVTPPFLMEQAVRLEPGARFSLAIPYLIGGRRGALEGVSWNRPGRYTLKVLYRVTSLDDLGRERDLYVHGGDYSFTVPPP